MIVLLIFCGVAIAGLATVAIVIGLLLWKIAGTCELCFDEQERTCTSGILEGTALIYRDRHDLLIPPGSELLGATTVGPTVRPPSASARIEISLN